MTRSLLVENLTKRSTKVLLLFLAFLVILIGTLEFFRLKEDLTNQFSSQSRSMLRPLSTFYISGDLVSLKSYLDTLSSLQDFTGKLSDLEKNKLWEKSFVDGKDSFFKIHYTSPLEFENGSKYGFAHFERDISKDYILHFKKLLLTLFSVLFISISFIAIHQRLVRVSLRPLYDVKNDLKKQADALNFNLREETEHELEDIRFWFFSVSNAWKQQHQIIQAQSMKIAKSELATQVAHDIRSPLSALQTSIEFLQLPESESKTLALRAISRIQKIASDLLAENRNLASRPILKFSSIPLLINNIVEEKNCQHLMKTSPIRFENRAETHLYSSINEKEVERAISNLIDNSIQATEPGNRNILIVLSSDEKFIYIRILDNGIGISDEAIKALGRERFSVGKEGIVNGNGIGLFHAYKTFLDCNGKFSIRRNNKGGTHICITLPLVNNNRATQSEISSETGKPSNLSF